MSDEIPGWDCTTWEVSLEPTTTSLELSVNAPGEDGKVYVLSLQRLSGEINTSACKAVKKRKRILITAKKKRKGTWGNLQKAH